MKPVSWVLLGLCAILAAGGYAQVLISPIFWCGRVEAFPGTVILASICLAQTALYLAAAASPEWVKLYRLSQIAVLPFLLAGLFQVFQPYPRTLVCCAVLAAIPVTLSLVMARWRWMRPHLLPVTAVYIVSTLGFLAAFGQIPLTLRGVVAAPWQIDLAAIVAAFVSIGVIGSLRGRAVADGGIMPGLARYLPLALLLFPVLRGKLPDVAYDSTMYKTTLPYQMAEWLTGDTAIIDEFMVVPNLQEMLNALLVVITRDYIPPLISTISFVLLMFVTPLAFPVERRATAIGRGVTAFAAVSAFVVTEAGIGQGTSHHEPLLLLFLCASLIRCPVWPVFLAIAIVVKINAIFIAPLVLLYHVLNYPAFWRSPRRLMLVALGCAIVLVPQFNRNVVFSGRLFGLNETLAAVTDPPGPRQIMSAGQTRYDAKVRGGIASNAALSACNMFMLDVICPTQYDNSDTYGFHIFPASRSALFGALFALAAIPGALVYRSRRLAGLMSAALFFAGYLALLAFLAESRFFLPLSFGFAVLLLINPEQAEDAVRTMGGSRPGRLLAVGLGCWCVGSDLIAGTFTNVSWICGRDLLAPAHMVNLREPETPVQRFLVAYVNAYKRTCPPPGLPPVILAEHDILNSPYLGTQRIFYAFTQEMIGRFFAADPGRQRRAGEAIIAVVSQSAAYDAAVLGPAVSSYRPCFHDDKTDVICSALLAPAAAHCASSLYPP